MLACPVVVGWGERGLRGPGGHSEVPVAML